ncbi:hypothetical protein PILCRDRAFT_10701 [Piloderma croceum F 1598]|uniref:DUF6589 domain-containing protein n=1 Tax=Piloderma croceum (strain F 1598) TaxID=765440 RepID=A0A0C3FGS1_PILCF|nr:hypothetical protein PILCRDRAFT_10701 [Piloderma croceum F 1598]
MHIDESSLEGTLKVLDSIITKMLKLLGNGLEKHRIILCAGDQLTRSLLDKASASCCDDSVLIDNVGHYTEGQLGPFHVKMAGDCMVVNEFWGDFGWVEIKNTATFLSNLELIVCLTLPAHILDGFWLFCPSERMEEWVANVKDHSDISNIAKRILTELCSTQHVAELCHLPDAKRDIPHKNIQLFNRDSLILLILKHAIKRGDIGSVINVLSHWMLMFRGTGKMPKYADALFHLLSHLKHMDPHLCNAFLKNWLANLSDKVDGFKEMDLLQEHHNFWAKIIYNARSSNRNWEWLAMVMVSIFILRDVIQKVQQSYKIPFNSTSHTSPSANEDIKDLRDYLWDNNLQMYLPNCEHNDKATPACDLLAEGAMYANMARTFKNFWQDTHKATNLGTAHGEKLFTEDPNTDLEEHADHDLGGDLDINVDDLALDEEEFPLGTDIADLVAMTQEFVNELLQYD